MRMVSSGATRTRARRYGRRGPGSAAMLALALSLLAAGCVMVESGTGGTSGGDLEIGGCAALPVTAERLEEVDAQLAAVEKDLAGVAVLLGAVERCFSEEDSDQDPSQPDARLMTAEQSGWLAEEFGASEEATSAQLEKRMREAEGELDALSGPLSSSDEDLALRQGRAVLLRRAVDAAKDALRNLRHLSLMPEAVKPLREEDAAFAEVSSAMDRVAAAFEADGDPMEPMLQACDLNRARLAPCMRLADKVVGRLAKRSGYNGAPSYLDRRRSLRELSESLAGFEEAFQVYSNARSGQASVDAANAVNEAGDKVTDVYDGIRSDDPRGRPSVFLRQWYEDQFGSSLRLIDDCLAESRELAKEAKGKP